MTGAFRMRLCHRTGVNGDQQMVTPILSRVSSTPDDFTVVSRSLHIVWFEELKAGVPVN